MNGDTPGNLGPTSREDAPGHRTLPPATRPTKTMSWPLGVRFWVSGPASYPWVTG
jgi:hypothetical protein